MISLFLQTLFKNGMKYFNGAFLFNKDSEKSDQNSLGSYILVRKDGEKSDQNSWGSYVLDDFGTIYNLLDSIIYTVATNQDVLLFKLLTFLGVLLTETCY